MTGEVLRPCGRGLTGSVTAQRESSPLTPHPCPFAPPSKARSVAFERPSCYVCLLLKARAGRKQPSAMPCISTRAAVGTRCGSQPPALPLAPSVPVPSLPKFCSVFSLLDLLGNPLGPTLLAPTFSTGMRRLRVLGPLRAWVRGAFLVTQQGMCAGEGFSGTSTCSMCSLASLMADSFVRRSCCLGFLCCFPCL